MEVNPRLASLLETDEFDWDDEKHREMLLRSWVKQGSQAFRQETQSQERPVE